jgi:crotonobetainyl-CoA:carnitine CoA-transferase CaiB-like acyl-CoA transferase
MTAGPLEGVRVLELGHAVSAPHCAQILADQGAEVIRIEPPGGDRTRWALPVIEQDSLYFAAHNRGKYSVIINLKEPRGRELFLELADTADVVVTNYSARVPDRLGIGYETLRERNPRVIFVHITGFGASGAGRDYGAYDGIIQAMSGVPSLTGDPGGPPVLVGAFVADHFAALQAAVGALLALARRTTTGTGGFIEISMLEGYFSTLAHHVASAVDLGLTPAANANQVQTAFANTFPAADGFVYLAPLAPHAWQSLCAIIGAPAQVADGSPRWRITEGRTECERVVSEWTVSRPRDEIVTRLRAAGVPCGPVNNVADAVSDPVHAGRDPITTVRMPSGRILHVPGPEVRLGVVADAEDQAPLAEPRVRMVPAAGAHTAQVLASLGHTPAEIAALASDGVIGTCDDIPTPPSPPSAALTTAHAEGA